MEIINPDKGFNSTMVRLKAITWMIPETWDSFQFHNGSIKGVCRDCYYV